MHLLRSERTDTNRHEFEASVRQLPSPCLQACQATSSRLQILQLQQAIIGNATTLVTDNLERIDISRFSDTV